MESDQFLQRFNSSDLEIAEEFLTNWLPFLTNGLCKGCSDVLRHRIQSLNTGHNQVASINHIENIDLDEEQEKELRKPRMSWADIAQQEEFEEEREKSLDDDVVEGMGKMSLEKTPLPREQRELMRYSGVIRKKDYVCLERIDGKIVNVLKGLELHSGIFSAVEQKRIVDFVYSLQEKGRNNEFGEHTYSEPRKWMRGKGRVTIQFGCCYNYAEKNGTPPGILRHAIADPIPNLLKTMIKRLIRWQVLPTYCVPDSCIVNIYEPGDCIPPHIDNHDFVRPFCTVSFLSECNIVFGSNLKIAGPGEFIGSTSIPLPVGSALVLNGNGADVAKHCVPAVPSKRISITFRKMDKAKWPHGFKLEPDLQDIEPYDSSAEMESQQENKETEAFVDLPTMRKPNGRSNRAFHWSERRVPTQQRHENTPNPDIGSDSFVRRHSGHRKERIRTTWNNQRVR